MTGGHRPSSPPGSPGSRAAASFSRILTRVSSLSHPHQHALEVFKARIAEHHLDIPAAMLYNNDLDAMCARFLRARKWNVEAAYQMLVKSLEWRKKVGVSTTEERRSISSASNLHIRSRFKNVKIQETCT